MTIGTHDFSSSGAMNPAGFATAVTPSDSTELDKLTRALYVGGTGDITVEMAGDTAGETTVTFVDVATGCVLPIRCKKVLATGTTATNIVGLS